MSTSPALARRWLAAIIIAAAVLLAVVGQASPSRAIVPPLSISIEGNHFVNSNGQTIRLLGVDVPGTEYACEEGWGYSSLSTSPAADATVAASIAGWDANAVRVPLNEDCWLGINGQPSYGTQSGYQQSIENWVSALNAAGIYAILDLHWSAPGTNVSNGQRPMPDDHSAAFWSSVATTFKSNPAVVFDAFNEPYSPAEDGDSTDAVSWSCWENGGCTLPVAADGTTPNDSDTYTAVGMQTLVTAIRAAGASQPIMVGGLSYSNDLSGWLTNEPTDPDNQLAASFHDYYGNACDTTTCWNATIAPVAEEVPVVSGEFDQGYDCQGMPSSPTALADFDQTFMDWADANGVSYTAWGWWELAPDPGTTACSTLASGGANEYALIDDEGNAMAPDGTTLETHLKALADSVSPPSSSVSLSSSQPRGSVVGQSVTFTATVTLTGGGSADGSVAFSSGGKALGGPVTVNAGTASTVTDALALGSDVVNAIFNPADATEQASSATHITQVVASASPVSQTRNSGYDLVGSDGGVFVLPTGQPGGYYGSLPGLGIHVNNIVGIVPSSDSKGYFLVGSDGGVFSFGDTSYEGSLPGLAPPVHVSDIAGIVPTSDSRGYFLVGRDGGVFSFGDAPYLGSLPGNGIHVNDVVGIAADVGAQGYWVVEANGAVHAFGHATSFGAASATPSPIASMASTPGGGGYWVVSQNGDVQPFGDAVSYGSLPQLRVSPTKPVVAIAPTSDGKGYWLIGSDGGIFSFGDALNVGSLPGLGLAVSNIVGAVPTSG